VRTGTCNDQDAHQSDRRRDCRGIRATSAGTLPAYAAGKSQTEMKTTQAAPASEFSARKRYYRGYHNNNAAAAAAFTAIVGGIAAYAAAREYRKARERGYYGPYGYGPYDGPYRW
jgi:hypothetical protein